MTLYTLTIFLSAFLLFQVQPLIAKHILPWYGGGPGVWTACMLFFQVFLLLGYAYAHGVNVRLAARSQAVLHIVLLLLSLALVSIAPDPDWRPRSGDSPTIHILVLLAAHVGVPFAILASTSPLLMRWFSRSWPDRPPYRLYALSNAGSLLALLSYPFIIEPALTLGTQERTWSVGYAVFVAICAAVSWRFLRSARSAEISGGVELTDGAIGSPEGGHDTLLWLALAATGSILLLATTNQICQDLTVVPLLWIMPLAIYLLSFIICFDHERWYQPAVFLPLLAISAIGVAWVMNNSDPGWVQVLIFASALFAGTMVCHGELVRIKPATRHLTRFYLAVAAGGALGGLFVGIVAPQLFPGYWEYPLGLVGTAVLAMVCARRSGMGIASGVRGVRLAWTGALLVSCGVTGALVWHEVDVLSGSLESSRTFFGVNRVVSVERISGPARVMWHGRIAHGAQFTDEAKRGLPTSYFGPESGVGIALERYRALRGDSGRGLRVGVLGLGTGTLSAYGLSGDYFRFYEIDPDVERIAREYFTYLDDSAAAVEVVLGDARLMLEQAPTDGNPFDVFVLDAFSGDAVPVHLLTREAYQIYLSHLRPDGLLVFNVSNRYLDLVPLVRGLAEEVGQQTVRIISSGDAWCDTRDARYVIATRNREFLEEQSVRVAATPYEPEEPAPLVWTDDAASLWSVVTRRFVAGRWDSAPNLGHFVVDRGDFIAHEEEARIRTLSQALYSDTQGGSAIMVVTAESMRAGGAGEEPFEEFTSLLYRKLGMTRPGLDRGLLVFISKTDRRAGVHVGSEWPAALREQIDSMFRRTAIAGLSQGRASRGILEFVEAFDGFVRARLSSG
jgi:SAM-dependent methyltransferase